MTVAEYHRELTARLEAILGERLLGVYASGSFGLADFDGSRSDLDVFAVCRGTVAAAEKHEIVARLRHEALPCPARGLEFVLYPEETARVPSAEAGFALNLDTGPAIGFRVDEEPGAVERHWFPIDRAIVRTAGVALAGPPPDELFAPIPRGLLLPAVREALEWHRTPGNCGDDDAVLNACRSLRWLREDVWSSKSEAGAWALEHVDDRELVAAALASRTRSAHLDRERVEHFVDAVLAESR
ncbi:MAG TPA: aminoglycoside adenylyltransferase domain-containing protein [Gaiellaceae bacterium]|nr:aminoglycoside adenylyltransferase domain-containing protein [Gaiellaceae bacterium]